MKIDKKIVAISGKQFSGKDTVADVLVTELSGFIKAPLAKLIKEKFSQEKGLAVDIIDMNKPVYRVDLIELGNRMREEDPDYWIKAVLEAGDSILVSDMRLKNEFNSFKKMNAITIRVNSPREERAKRGLIVSEYDSTEVDLDDITEWDYVLYNDGTHEELKQKARALANEIKKRLI